MIEQIENIKAETKGHSIFCGDRKLRSPSSVWKKIENGFDEKFWAAYVSCKESGYECYPIPEKREIGIKKLGVFYFEKISSVIPLNKMPEDILKLWKKKGAYGMTGGNFIDHYIQFKEELSPYDFEILKKYKDDVVVSKGGTEYKELDLFKTKVLDVLKSHCDKFLNDYQHIEIIHHELPVGSCELGIGGRIDAIGYDHHHNKYVIIDWKTDAKIDFKNKYKKKLKDPVSHLDECNFVKYCLQTSFYNHIVLHETDIVPETMIVWFSKKNKSYKVIKTPYFHDELKRITRGISEGSL